MPDALILDTEEEDKRLRVVYYPDLGGEVKVQTQECVGVTRGRKDWEVVDEAVFPGRVVKILGGKFFARRFETAAVDAVQDEYSRIWEEVNDA